MTESVCSDPLRWIVSNLYMRPNGRYTILHADGFNDCERNALQDRFIPIIREENIDTDDGYPDGTYRTTVQIDDTHIRGLWKESQTNPAAMKILKVHLDHNLNALIRKAWTSIENGNDARNWSLSEETRAHADLRTTTSNKFWSRYMI